MIDNEGFELSPIKAIELAAARIPGAVSLAQGIPSFPTPQVIKEFVYEKISQGLCDKYSLTNGLAELRDELSLALKKEGLNYNPETEVVVTAGSIEALTASVLASTSPGDEVLVPSPTYASYRGALYIARCTPRYVELDEDNNFDFHVERIAAAISRRTRAILYCSPNNPTGTLFSEEKTRRLVELAQEHNLTIIADEVYKDFYYGNEKHFSAVSIPEARTNVIRVCSFSKAYAMTGWRIGFVHTDAKLMQRILKYHDAMVTCAPVVSQYAALAALRFAEPCLVDFRNEFKRRRDYTIQVLDTLSHVLDYQVPRATYFVFPRIKDTVPLSHDSNTLAYDILNRAKVAVVPGIAFGPSGESHIRINFGREMNDVEAGLDRLSQYFKNSRNSKVLQTNQSSFAPEQVVKERSPFRIFAKRILKFASRAYLARNRPLIVGIAGTRGKTVVKRILTDLLRTHYATRSTILSYNTEIGLPLSVLNLSPPRNTSDKISFAFKLLMHAFLKKEKAKLLVLEYGVMNEEDVEALLGIAVPDWLVLTGIGASDPSEISRGLQAGLKRLVERLPRERVIWFADDAWVQELKLVPELGVRPSDPLVRQVVTAANTYRLEREIVGQSAQHGVIGATILAECLHVPQAKIAQYLQTVS